MPDETKIKVPTKPLQRIALTCSGGGYRATTFHLGAMSYLNHLTYNDKPLLENVKAISTVSGGTFTGVMYAAKRIEGLSFPEIYHFMIEKLRQLDLVKLGLNQLNPEQSWTYSNKRRNLINAFAEIYDREFTGGKKFEVFRGLANTHLEEVMFNATEFHHGFIFRFQNRGVFGNARFRVPQQVADQVRLGDIIAASSCFTGGFEPIEWPHDFIGDGELPSEARLQDLKETSLMDGGIYDNQGVDSILRAERRVGVEPYDLIIVSDVTSPYMKPFSFDDAQEVSIWGTKNISELQNKLISLYKSAKYFLIFIPVLALIFGLLFQLGNSILTGVLISVSLVALCLLVLMYFSKLKFSQLKEKVVHELEQKLTDQIPLASLSTLEINIIPFGQLESLLADRLNSLVSLVGDVWLKVVRRLVYRQLYESDQYEYRRTSNLIRELTRTDYEAMQQRAGMDGRTPFFELDDCDDILKGSYSQVISKKIEEIADAASSFGTNLWFTKQNELEGTLNKLVICGQLSMCFNLLIYLTELMFTPENGFSDLDREKQEKIRRTYDQCITDWKAFQDDPELLFRQLEKQVG